MDDAHHVGPHSSYEKEATGGGGWSQWAPWRAFIATLCEIEELEALIDACR